MGGYHLKSCVRVWTGFIWFRIGSIVTGCEHADEPWGSIKSGKFINHLGSYQVLKDSVP